MVIVSDGSDSMRGSNCEVFYVATQDYVSYLVWL